MKDFCSALLIEIRQVKELLLIIHRYLLKTEEEEETVYRDAGYVMDRVGISESTLLRCQKNGLIAVAKTAKGKKFFRDKDVEHLRKIYWGM